MKPIINNDITLSQYVFLIHGAQIGISVVTTPHRLAMLSGTDGWISILIGWVIATMSSLIIIKVMDKNANKTIIGILKHYFGKWISKFFIIVLAFYMALLAFFEMHRMALHIKSWVLQQTSVYSLVFLFSISSYSIICGGVKNIGRYAELIFFMSIWLIVIFFIPLEARQWVNLFPLFKGGIHSILTSVKTSLFSFLGFELALFLYPYLQNKKKATLGILIANTCSAFLYLYITITCFLFFSPDELTHYYEPTLAMLRVIEFKFAERFDLILLSFYILIVSKVWMINIFFTVISIKQIFNKRNYNTLLLGLLALFVFISYITNLSFGDSEKILNFLELVGLIIAYIFPLSLLLYMIMFDFAHKRVKK
ncbi:GerAB/ArcD/ProY family transporter [Bacillus cereus]|uniref:GerAB/ArcD/ProY family transporter n=1 Tax=Bacillus cereus TaxID=1396 RepID=UPI000BED6AB3|nr:endospore germination permease [Bacillus cereus]PEF60753.1 spore gernimation protein [Bacillus cereus]